MRLKDAVLKRSSEVVDKRPLRPSWRREGPPIEPTAARRALVSSYVRATRSPSDDVAFERAIGTNDLVGLEYLWNGIAAARAVARVVIPASPSDPGGFATGFLVAPGLFLTNWHVLETEEVAATASLQFGYEAGPEGAVGESTYFTCDPERFYVSDEGLDYCVVAVDPASKHGPHDAESFGWLRLNSRLGKTDYGQFVSVIQHPGGGVKQVAIRENEILQFDETDDYLCYVSDTFRGSSGSPVLNDFWDVVALHSAGKPRKDAEGNYLDHNGQPIVGRRPEEHEIQWIANTGARVSRIVAHLEARAASYPQWKEQWDTLERTFSGDLKPRSTAVGRNGGLVRESGPGPVPPQSLPLDSRRVAWLAVPLGVTIGLSDGSESRPAPAVAAAPRAETAGRPATGPAPERLNFDRDYAGRRGYDERFLGADRRVPLPTIARERTGELARLIGSRASTLHYHHFSIRQHRGYKMPALAASNVDYRGTARDDRGRSDFGTDQWILDERLRPEDQLPPGFYDRARRLDYGHLVRRDDNTWGASPKEIEFSNADTFHMTNCTPQHEAFNRAVFGFHGLWGTLENVISRQAEADRVISKLCVFSGPIFDPKRDLVIQDSAIGKVRVPLAFWKVIVAPTRSGELRSYGFVLSQAQDLEDDPPFEDFSPAASVHEQKSLEVIESRTMVRFAESLKSVDVMAGVNPNEKFVLQSPEDIFFGRR